jgi:germination protein M
MGSEQCLSRVSGAAAPFLCQASDIARGCLGRLSGTIAGERRELRVARLWPFKISAVAAVLLALALGAAACGSAGDASSPEATATSRPEASPDVPAAETSVNIYLIRGERLGVALRQVPRTLAVARAALEELLNGPNEKDEEAGLATEIPPGTRLLDVNVRDGVATVDLSGRFASGGGSPSMQLRVAQVVYTLTQFRSVESVAFMLDGQRVDAVGGEGVIVSPPVDRLDFADNTAPAVLVESPAPWQEVTSPLRVTGMSNTFEATLLYELVDASGEIVEEGFATATAGSGTWGTFNFRIRYQTNSAGEASLVLFEQSAKDGSRINEVEIPITLTE